MRLAIALVLILLPGCASTAAAFKEMSRGSCQAQCHDDHPDSLYDANRCIDTFCTPPPC